MEADKLIVLFAGLIGVGFVYWFFFMKREKETRVSGSVDIMVDGGYTPEVISVEKNMPISLRFYRKDPNTCLEEVVLPDFGIKKTLPLNMWVEVVFTPDKPGTFLFHCAMNMYRGTLIVR